MTIDIWYSFQDPKINLGTPESHVWEVVGRDNIDGSINLQNFAIMNKQTGQFYKIVWSLNDKKYKYYE